MVWMLLTGIIKPTQCQPHAPLQLRLVSAGCEGVGLLRLAKMGDISIALINTRLQPGGVGVPVSEPFQRLAGEGETVETVLNCLADRHRAEARC